MDYDKIKKIVDLSQWGNIPVEEIPIWELRDVLSHSPFLDLTAKEQQLVEDIAANQQFFSWRKENLSIFGEAKVQQLLRLEGYELFCADLNDFPTNSKDLRQHISKHSLRRQINFYSKHLKHQIKDKFYQSLVYMYKLCGFHGTFLPGQIVMVGLMAYAIYSNVNLLIPALITAYISSNCMAIVIHDYWVHDQLRPKNRLVGFIFDYLGLMFFGERLRWKYRHNYHHIHWKTTKDVEQLKMLAHSWWYYLFVNKNMYSQKHGDLSGRLAKLRGESDQYRSSVIGQLPPESQFLENYVIEITIISNFLLLLLLGPVIYIYFVFFQVWVFQKYIPGFNELVTHYNDKTREQEADTPYLFPICCGTAYHNTHHMYPTTLVLGPAWTKYFNVQYYFVRLFYRLKPGIIMS